MLNKTLKLLAAIAPGTYVEPGTACFDEAELHELGGVLNRLIYAPSELRKELERFGVILTRGDFYAEVPTIAEVEASRDAAPFLTAPFGDAAALADLLAELARWSREFNPPRRSAAAGRFRWDNGQFTGSDAMAYYAMIRHVRPKTIVELGCGMSTLVARAALARNGSGRLVCIEPFPSDALRQLDGIRLIEQTAQSLDVALLDELLDDGDMLFIDTTHTVKHNSDCIHLYLRLLPNIARDLTVHVHDIHLPGPLPLVMLRDLQIHWTEQYLLYAYLLDNPRVRTLYGAAYHQHANPEGLAQLMHGRYPATGASFWFRQNKRA